MSPNGLKSGVLRGILVNLGTAWATPAGIPSPSIAAARYCLTELNNAMVGESQTTVAVPEPSAVGMLLLLAAGLLVKSKCCGG